MLVVNNVGYFDDLDRVEYLIEIIAKMHEFFGISMEEAAGRFDQYAHEAMRFVKSDMLFHETTEELAWFIYYGKDEWQRRGITKLAPKPYP